jgi:hypothetical protein
MTRRSTKLVREGKFAAEIEIELIDSPEGWAPYLSVEEAQKLDEVRKFLRAGNVAEASHYGRVFELRPVSA